MFAKIKHDALTYTDVSEEAFNITMTRTYSDRRRMRDINLMETRLMNEV